MPKHPVPPKGVLKLVGLNNYLNIVYMLKHYLNIAKMIVVGNSPAQDYFSKLSICNFSGLKKCKKKGYRNDRKNLPWEASPQNLGLLLMIDD